MIFIVGLYHVVYYMVMKGDVKMNIEIEKNIPIPPEKKRNVYPYKIMDIGESFVIPQAKIQIVCNANYRAGKASGKKFIARREGDGVRVWRTS
jgi:hypothetical protein